MSLTGSGPDDPQRVGVPIGDLLAGMYGAYGVLAALLERERTGRGQVVRTSLLAAIVGVHAFQGTAWTVAGEVGRAQGNHHPSIAPVRPVPLPGRQRAAVLRQRGAVAPAVRGVRLRPRRAGHGHQRRAGRQPRARSSPCSRRPSPTSTPRTCWPGWPGPASRRARCAPSTRSTAGTRRCRRACSSTSSTRRSAGCRCPARRCGSSRPARTARSETTRREHAAPPVLGRRRRRDPRLAGRPTASPAGRGRRRGRARDMSADRLDARALRDLVLDPGSWMSWDSPVPRARRVRSATRASWPRQREKSRQDESIITGEGRLRGRRVAVVAGEFGFLAGSIGVAAAERLIAAVERATEEGLPLLAAPGLRRHPDAGGHRRLPADDRHHRRHRPAQGGRAALPGLPAQPHVRRRAGVLGLARPRDDRRARRLDRLPRAAGLPGALRRAVPRGRADRRAPGRARPARRRRPARGDRRRRRPGAAGAGGPADLAPRRRRTPSGPGRRTAPTPTTPRTTAAPGTSSPPPGATTGPGCAGCCGPRRPTSSGSPAPAPARRTPGCCWRWPASGARRASSSARTGAGSRCRRRSGRPRCARPAAACTWPRSCGCRWSR